MEKTYQYDGLEAELYDELDELSDFDDISFYQWFVESEPGRVLDLGCGTGRVLLPLALSGLEVVGLDASPAMLEICQNRLRERGLSARLIQGDMRKFDLGEERFGTILIPGFSIQMLLEDEEVTSCLESCRRHLKEGGQLIVPTNIPLEMIWDEREKRPLEECKRIKLSGDQGSLIAEQGWAIDHEKQRLYLKNRYTHAATDESVQRREEKEMSIRWHLPHQMMQKLGEIGFTDISVYGDFSFEPPDGESESVIYLARV